MNNKCLSLPNLRLVTGALVVLGVCAFGERANAQGLLWSLPDQEGASIQFDGTYKQSTKRNDPAEPDVEVEWLRQITLKYLARTTAPYQKPGATEAETVPAKWIEIKVVTGKAGEGGGIDPGPSGQRIYKILVPEPGFVGKPVDEEGIEVSFIPIAQGFVKVGDGEPQPIEGKVFRMYPLVSLLRSYDNYEPTLDAPEAAVDPEVDADIPDLAATHHKGTYKSEDRTNRWLQEAEIWLSGQVPFGIVRWSLRMTGEKKLSSEQRTEFQEVTEILIEMKAKEVRNDAKSELNVP